MSEMVDRVARAMAGKITASVQLDSNGGASVVVDFGMVARVAIETMREPTEAMSNAAHEEWDWGPGTSLDGHDADAARCWQTMIDEAVK